MNAKNSTGNPASLPLHERAQQGLLAAESELRLDEIAELECPERRYGPKMEAWIKRLETACKYGALRLKPGDVFDEFGGWPYIPRENYRAWRAIQKNLPVDSIIDLWLGDPLTAESIPPVETSLPESVAVAQGGAARPATRAIALFDAENTALLMLRKELKREPDFEEFWDYLTARDDTGTVADSTDDLLMWTGKDGRNCTTSRSSIRNRLTSAKKRNPFTPS